MSTIKSIYAYEIIDSKGIPTIEARLTLDTDEYVTTSVPGAAGNPSKEPVDLKDEDPNRFTGMGVLHAVSYINELIAPKIKGASITKQIEIDKWLMEADGTKNKSRLGVNTILTISQLIAKAAARSARIPLFRYINKLYQTVYKQDLPIEKIPTPIFNTINGGAHANNTIDFQEFQIIPSSSFSFGLAYQKTVEVFFELKQVLEYRNATTAVGEEGGFSPNLTTNLDALEILVETITQKKMKCGLDIFLGIDLAASRFYKNGQYTIKDKSHSLKGDEYSDFLQNITQNYSILAMEDPFAEDDWEGWKKFTSKVSSSIYIIADEAVRMNREKLAYAIRENACTSFLIKPNQIGTLTGVLELVNIARINNVSYIVAAVSSETNDDFIADLAVAIQSEFVKFGAPTRGERVAKYNRLWQIERDELGK
ncbi:MAG: enolase C-terminal domain-like protein [Patescibacteria group bacterium]